MAGRQVEVGRLCEARLSDSRGRVKTGCVEAGGQGGRDWEAGQGWEAGQDATGAEVSVNVSP